MSALPSLLHTKFKGTSLLSMSCALPALKVSWRRRNVLSKTGAVEDMFKILDNKKPWSLRVSTLAYVLSSTHVDMTISDLVACTICQNTLKLKTMRGMFWSEKDGSVSLRKRSQLMNRASREHHRFAILSHLQSMPSTHSCASCRLKQIRNDMCGHTAAFLGV